MTRKKHIKNQLIELLTQEMTSVHHLERNKLLILKQKLQSHTLNDDEKWFLIDEIVSHHLQFDPHSDEPIGNTLEIEAMIDFLLPN